MHRDLVFQGKRSIDDHDAIVWLGDFNYRINLGNERVRELACEKKYLELFEMDQVSWPSQVANTFANRLRS